MGHVDDAARATAAVAGLLIVIQLAVTARSGFSLPENLRALIGISPATTYTRPWAFFTAPFFHYGFGHLAYNLVVLALTLPFALRAVGVSKGLAAAYLASPLAGFLVNALVILPLAAAGVTVAERAVDDRLVGASVVAFAGAGIALATRGWPPLAVAAVTAAYVAYEAGLAATGLTQGFVGAYHVTGFLLGLAFGGAAGR